MKYFSVTFLNIVNLPVSIFINGMKIVFHRNEKCISSQ